MTSLRTERLLLRRPTRDDLPPWMDFLASSRGVWFGGGPEGGLGMAWRIAASYLGHWQIRGYGKFTVEDAASGRPIGSVGPHFPEGHGERELTWAIWREEDEGKGYAYEAARGVLRHLYQDLRWDQVVSYIAPENARSIALAERLGAHVDPSDGEDDDDLTYRHDPEGAQ